MAKKDNNNSEYTEADYTEFIATPHTEALVERSPVKTIIYYSIYALLGIIAVCVIIFVALGIRKEIDQQRRVEPFVSHKRDIVVEPEEEPTIVATSSLKNNQADKSTRRLIGHKKVVTTLAVSPDSRYLLSGEGDAHYNSAEDDDMPPLPGQAQRKKTGVYYLYVWNFKQGKPERMLDMHRNPISAVAFSQDGSRAASADIGGNFIVWDTNSWTVLDTFTPEIRANKGMDKVLSINSLAFSFDGAVLAAGGSVTPQQSPGGDKNQDHRKSSVILWDLREHQEITQNTNLAVRTPFYDFSPETDCVFSLSYASKGKYIIAGISGANAGVYIMERGGAIAQALDLSTKKTSLSTDMTQYSTGHNSPACSYIKCDTRYDNRRIAAADNYGRMSLWEFQGDLSGSERIQAMDFLNKQESVDKNLRDIKYSLDGKYIVTCGDEIAVWDGEEDSLKLLGYLTPQTESIYQNRLYFGLSIAMTRDGQSLVVACSDKVIRVWDFKQFPNSLRRVTPVERAEKMKTINSGSIEMPENLDFRAPKKSN